MIYSLESDKKITMAAKIAHPGIGEFSIASVQNFIDDHILVETAPKTRWIKVVPKKVNIHAWRVKIDNLPTRFNLSPRGMDLDFILCPTCNVAVETTSHILFNCSMAKEIYKRIARWWDINILVTSTYEEWGDHGRIHSFYWKRLPHKTYVFGMRSTVIFEPSSLFSELLEIITLLSSLDHLCHEYEHVVMNPTQLEWGTATFVDSKNSLDRVSSCTCLFSLPERIKADNTIRVNQLVTILLIESSIHLLDQNRYPVDTSLIHIESRKSPTVLVFDVETRRIFIRHCKTEQYHSECSSNITRIMRKTL
ncbi:RNA-directed DNA polymerase, eukaryota [Tanacetum coccineum]